MLRKFRRAAMALLLAISLFSLWQLLQFRQEDQAGEDIYTRLEQYAAPSCTAPSLLPEPASSVSTVPTQPAPTEPPVDFEALREINPDTVGWITIEGTSIHYPVVQGSDNSHYINHLFDGTRNRTGAIFLDYRNAPDLSDPHTIIYGHHLQNGTMFSELEGYKTQTFYDLHPTGQLITPDGVYTLHFFAGYVADTESDAWQMDLSGEDFTVWLDRSIRRSWFRAEGYPSSGDRIVTLSTCSYEFDEARFVLLGYLG